MATKKRTKKKQTKRKKLAGKKARPVKKTAKKTLSKSKVAKKKAPQKKAPQKKAPPKAKVVGKKTMGRGTVTTTRKPVRRRSQSVATEEFSLEPQVSRSGTQSGDLQGLSGVGRAGSESVDELLEEGNAFEADAVMGVAEADDAEGEEVHTHEVPEDDVPGEYLDKD
jgi:hypothetical protein